MIFSFKNGCLNSNAVYLRPGLEGFSSNIDGVLEFSISRLRSLGNEFLSDGVLNVEVLSGLGLNKFTIDEVGEELFF